jgi:hypothetical protein
VPIFRGESGKVTSSVQPSMLRGKLCFRFSCGDQNGIFKSGEARDIAAHVQPSVLIHRTVRNSVERLTVHMKAKVCNGIRHAKA